MSELLENFVVSIVNLKTGKHNYDFLCDTSFFEEYDYSLVKAGNIVCSLEIEKQREVLFILNFFIKGTIQLACDTCLEIGDYPIEERHRMILKLVDNSSLNEKSIDEDLILLPLDTHSFDSKPFFYEMITLSVPMKVSCELINEDCNPEMLKFLAGEKSKLDDDDNNDSNDPRWDILNKLK